jgi:hypothetical protein
MRSHRLVLGLVTCLTACSFAGVRGPSSRVGLVPNDPSELKCTESALLPSLDALGGALAISAAGGGILIEQTSEDGSLDNFTKYYAGPLIAAGILYFVSASFGNNRITWCTDAKERSMRARDAVRPIELPAPTRPPARDTDDEPDIEIHR